MRHARPDYDRIQDPAGLIPEEEPVFLLRAKDVTAPAVVLYWADQAESLGVAPGMVEHARAHAKAMRGWQKAHGWQVPDMPDPGAPSGA